MCNPGTGHAIAMKADETLRSTAARQLTDYLRRSGRRCTPERYMVLASAEAMKGHFSVDELCVRLADDARRVAKGTVYSTLELLVECGLARRLSVAGATRYEFALVSHHHLVCTRCGKIKDVRDSGLDEALRARRYSAFTPSAFSLVVYGICSACARKARRADSVNKKQPSENVTSKIKK